MIYSQSLQLIPNVLPYTLYLKKSLSKISKGDSGTVKRRWTGNEMAKTKTKNKKTSHALQNTKEKTKD
jgi:hypothetical protein